MSRLGEWKKIKKAKTEFLHNRKGELKSILPASLSSSSAPKKDGGKPKDGSDSQSTAPAQLKKSQTEPLPNHEPNDSVDTNVTARSAPTSESSESDDDEPETPEQEELRSDGESDHKWVPQHSSWRKEALYGRVREEGSNQEAPKSEARH